jgi:hypothetical protein
MTRYFHLMYNDEIRGRFAGRVPKQAASKAFTALYKKNPRAQYGQGINVNLNLNVNEPINFSIIECTRGSKNKKFYYTGIRHKLDKERTMELRDRDLKIVKTINYKYYNSIKADKKRYIVGVGI